MRRILMIYVFLGAMFEIFWVSGLKYFSHFWLGIIGIVFAVMMSFWCLMQACKKVGVSIAYVIFVGLGTLGITCIEGFLERDLSFTQILLILVLLVGVIGIKMSEVQK